MADENEAWIVWRRVAVMKQSAGRGVAGCKAMCQGYLFFVPERGGDVPRPTLPAGVVFTAPPCIQVCTAMQLAGVDARFICDDFTSGVYTVATVQASVLVSDPDVVSAFAGAWDVSRGRVHGTGNVVSAAPGIGVPPTLVLDFVKRGCDIKVSEESSRAKLIGHGTSTSPGGLGGVTDARALNRLMLAGETDVSAVRSWLFGRTTGMVHVVMQSELCKSVPRWIGAGGNRVTVITPRTNTGEMLVHPLSHGVMFRLHVVVPGVVNAAAVPVRQESNGEPDSLEGLESVPTWRSPEEVLDCVIEALGGRDAYNELLFTIRQREAAMRAARAEYMDSLRKVPCNCSLRFGDAGSRTAIPRVEGASKPPGVTSAKKKEEPWSGRVDAGTPPLVVTRASNATFLPQGSCLQCNVCRESSWCPIAYVIDDAVPGVFIDSAHIAGYTSECGSDDDADGDVYVDDPVDDTDDVLDEHDAEDDDDENVHLGNNEHVVGGGSGLVIEGPVASYVSEASAGCGGDSASKTTSTLCAGGVPSTDLGGGSGGYTGGVPAHLSAPHDMSIHLSNWSITTLPSTVASTICAATRRQWIEREEARVNFKARVDSVLASAKCEALRDLLVECGSLVSAYPQLSVYMEPSAPPSGQEDGVAVSDNDAGLVSFPWSHKFRWLNHLLHDAFNFYEARDLSGMSRLVKEEPGKEPVVSCCTGEYGSICHPFLGFVKPGQPDSEVTWSYFHTCPPATCSHRGALDVTFRYRLQTTLVCSRVDQRCSDARAVCAGVEGMRVAPGAPPQYGFLGCYGGRVRFVRILTPGTFTILVRRPGSRDEWLRNDTYHIRGASDVHPGDVFDMACLWNDDDMEPCHHVNVACEGAGAGAGAGAGCGVSDVFADPVDPLTADGADGTDVKHGLRVWVCREAKLHAGVTGVKTTEKAAGCGAGSAGLRGPRHADNTLCATMLHAVRHTNPPRTPPGKRVREILPRFRFEAVPDHAKKGGSGDVRLPPALDAYPERIVVTFVGTALCDVRLSSAGFAYSSRVAAPQLQNSGVCFF